MRNLNCKIVVKIAVTMAVIIVSCVSLVQLMDVIYALEASQIVVGTLGVGSCG